MRRIVATATAQQQRMSAYVLGVVQSDAFRMTRLAVASADSTRGAKGVSGNSGSR